MGPLRAVIFRFIAALLVALPLFAEDVAESRRLYKNALDAYQKKDHAAFLENVRAASALRPQHPTLLYQLAVALTLNGRGDDALDVLERVAAMGFVYRAAEDEDLASLRGAPRFTAIAGRFAENAKPAGAATLAFTIPEKGLIPEGLAYDATTKRFFVSSVRRHAIYAIDPTGRARRLVRDLPSGVFGMVVDAKRETLWAATSALAEKKSALLRIDLRSGRVVDTIRAEGRHHFGDVTLTRDGRVLVSDGESPVIFELRENALQPFATGPFVSLQGIAAGPGVLYASDYSKGLFAIDLRTRDVHLMSVPPNASLLGVDGIYLAAPRTLVATQNGTNPNRIIRIRLTENGLDVASVETLLANVPALADPTLGVMANGAFYVNAAGQWDLFDDDGNVKDAEKLRPASVLRIPLP